jgi:opacity protein-like surface antigen
MSVRKMILGALVTSVWASTAIPASAQSVEGLYLRADAGWSYAANPNIRDQNEADHVIAGPGGARGTLTNLGSGWLAGGGAGMQFTPNFRADVVYAYRGGYHLDESDQAASPTTFKADFSSQSLMATGYVDFPIGIAGIVPFGGVGFGWDRVTVSSFAATGALAGTLPGGTSNNFAWQATAGAAFDVIPGIKLDLFVRYFDGGHAMTDPGNIVHGATVVGHYSGAGGSFHTYDFGVSLRVPVHV